MIDIINIIKTLEKFSSHLISSHLISSHLIAIIIASFVILNFLQNSIIYLEI